VPVLDTVVLFGAIDSEDERHETSVAHLKKLKWERDDYWLAGFALFEFDVVMKSRGFTFEQRMESHTLLIADFPEVATKTLANGPSVFRLAAELERDHGLDYFDAGVASESLQKSGVVISTDRIFDRIPNLSRIW
jgi:predicted nucleic acid-binding protein